MLLMVYGHYGRAGVYMFQQYCRLLIIGLDDQALEDLNTILRRCPHNHPLAPLFEHMSDF